MPLPVEELLGSHAADEVKGWVQSLHHFAFTGAFSNDRVSFPEALVVYVRFSGHDELVQLLEALGIYQKGDGKGPSVIAGEGSRNVAAFPDIAEPGDCTIAGAACNVVVTSASITITVSESGGGVTAARIEDAKKIEAKIEAAGLASRTFRPNTDYVIAADSFR